MALRLLKRGSSGHAVKSHKHSLNRWAGRFRIPRIPLDGPYDRATEHLNWQIEYLLGFTKPDHTAGKFSQAQLAKYDKRRTPGSRRQRLRSARRRANRRARLRAGVFHRSMLNGHPGNINRTCKRFVVRAVKAGLVVTSTTDLRHSPGSLHYSGKAVDVASWSWQKMHDFYLAEGRKRGHRWAQLFGPGNVYWQGGSRHSGQFPAHRDHVHAGSR